MATEVQTRRGHCPTHGAVEATRELPGAQFPFIYFGILRMIAKRRPFRCPSCGEPVTTS
jgi:hypothetical protein